MNTQRSFLFPLSCSILLLGALILSSGATGCGSFAEGVNDLTTFCRAVGEKCTQMQGSDCIDKLGNSNSVLKANPDYKGAKACLDQLTSCTTLPDECYFYAVERFINGEGNTTPDAGSTPSE